MIHKLTIEIDTDTVEEANSIATDIEQALSGRDIAAVLDQDVVAIKRFDLDLIEKYLRELHYGYFTGPKALQTIKETAGPLWASLGRAFEPNNDASMPQVLPFSHAKHVKVRPVVPGDEDDARMIALAHEEWHRDGEIEIDNDAIVSRGDDDGAYVAAWVWVRDPDGVIITTGPFVFRSSQENGDSADCRSCGKTLNDDTDEIVTNKAGFAFCKPACLLEDHDEGETLHAFLPGVQESWKCRECGDTAEGLMHSNTERNIEPLLWEGE